MELLEFALSIVVQKNFEAQRVVLVLPQRESVIRQQKPVIACAVAIKQLIALSVAGSVAGVHREVGVCEVVAEPLFVVLCVLSIFLKLEDALVQCSLQLDLV